jgi:DNA-binding transcriptional MerR regulator
LLTIGEFARESGLSAKALRLYDESGLLRPAHVDGLTGYRYYVTEQLARARRISLLRRLDMPLATVAEVLAEPDTVAAHRLLAWWEGEERRLVERRGTVDYLVGTWSGGPAPAFDVGCRTTVDRTVACLQARVLQPDLVDTMMRCVADLRDLLDRSRAERSEEFWVLYHGVVSPDSDGPIEVCVPFAGVVEPEGDVAIRVERAHREAWTPITAEQCRYPEILHAYDAVARWIGEHGVAEDPSRELYLVAWDGTPGPQHVADIAQPYREDST